MVNVITWTEIESSHNVRKHSKAYPEILMGEPKVTYRAKVKLHGTNAGIQCVNGNIFAQSRTNIITPQNDNAGFARWVHENEQHWKKATNLPTLDDQPSEHFINVLFFGEWFGPGVQKGVACSEIPKRSFAVFAMRILDKDGNPTDDMVVNPNALELYVKNIPDTYVLPWHDETIEIDWSDSVENLQPKVDLINSWVHNVEVNDPWIEKTFNIKGTGEGLVFYPVSKEHYASYETFTNLVFKAKGEKHKNIKSAAPAQLDASVAAGIDQFVEMVLTEARLEQGVNLNTPFDRSPKYEMKNVGAFIKWILGDVEKETQDELAASNLEWKQVQKQVGDKARAWYLAKSKQL